MNSSIHWNPVIPWVPLLLLSVVVLAALVLLELRRKQRFTWIRILCQVFIVISIGVVLGRPAFSLEIPGRPLLILTKGFDAARADSLIRTYPEVTVFTTPDAGEFKSATKLSSLRDLKGLTGEPVWVAGTGLPEHILSDTPFNFQFLPGAAPNGIIDINLPDKAVANNWNTINGNFHVSRPGRWILRLVGPGGIEDSTVFRGNADTRFALTFFPKVAGQFMYTLEVRDSIGAPQSSNRLPLVVEDNRKLEVLFINDYPSFEQRYLKNFLTSKGHRVSVRNRVSKNQYHKEFANRLAQPLDKLNATILDNADIMIIDQGSFQTIPDSEKKLIRRASEKGLGVLVFGSEKSKTNELISFQSFPASPDTARFSLGRPGFHTLPVAAIKPSGDISSLIVGTDGRALAGCLCSGDSRIGFQLLRETYQIGLQGKTDAYAALWSPLLEQVARRSQDNFKIVMRTPFPMFSNEPVDFDILSTGAAPVVNIDRMTSPMAEDDIIDDLWHGRAWADGDKWHTVSVGADSVKIDFHDLREGEWSELRAARQMEANRNHVTTSTGTNDFRVMTRGPWTLVLVLVFLLSSGFLWLAPKL